MIGYAEIIAALREKRQQFADDESLDRRAKALLDKPIRRVIEDLEDLRETERNLATKEEP